MVDILREIKTPYLCNLHTHSYINTVVIACISKLYIQSNVDVDRTSSKLNTVYYAGDSREVSGRYAIN